MYCWELQSRELAELVAPQVHDLKFAIPQAKVRSAQGRKVGDGIVFVFFCWGDMVLGEVVGFCMETWGDKLGQVEKGTGRYYIMLYLCKDPDLKQMLVSFSV